MTIKQIFRQHTRTQRQTKHPGLTLVDSVISLAILAIIVVVFAGLTGSRTLNRQVSYRAQAEALADEQLSALQSLDVTTLTNQSNGSLRNILYNAGDWHITNDANALDTSSSPCPPATTGLHCGTSVLELAKNAAITNGLSGRLQFPAGVYSGTAATPVTLQADWKIMADSPVGWSFGYTFRAADANNLYRIRLGAITTDLDSGTAGTQNVVLEKVVAGTTTTLFSTGSVTINTNTWYTLKLILADTSIKIYLNGTQLDNGSWTNAVYTSGAAALLGWNGVHAEVDDASSTVGATVKTWDFEGLSTLPAAWIRLGLNDLPDSTLTTFDDNGTLTITGYPTSSNTTLKQATVTIQWQQAGQAHAYTLSGLLGKSTLGQ